MATGPVLLAICIFVPLLGSPALLVLGRASARAREVAALALALVSLASAAALLPAALSGDRPALALAGAALFRADPLAAFMALVSALVGSIIVLYSWGYVAHREHRGEYYFMVALFLGAMMGLVFARHLLVLYLFWEMTALACWRLIGFSREPEHVRRADKAFLVTALGAFAMLVGFLLAAADAGTFDLERLRGAHLSSLAAALVLAGILSKSATLPLHGWLPDAGVAPAPVTALLHAAVLVKIGVYAYARLFVVTFTLDPVWHEVVPWIAAASALVSAGAALVAQDLKRIIAYSTVSQLGFILFALAIDDRTALGGGLLYIALHGVAKGGLFLCAGVVEHATHTKDLRQLGGLGRSMPLTAASFALCALSIMGVPPLGGFFAKYVVLTAALERGHLALALTFVFASVLTFLYLLRAFGAVFLGEPGPAAVGAPREGTRGMVGAVAALAALALAGGVGVQWPAQLAQAVAADCARAQPVARSAP